MTVRSAGNEDIALTIFANNTQGNSEACAHDRRSLQQTLLNLSDRYFDADRKCRYWLNPFVIAIVCFTANFLILNGLNLFIFNSLPNYWPEGSGVAVALLIRVNDSYNYYKWKLGAETNENLDFIEVKRRRSLVLSFLFTIPAFIINDVPYFTALGVFVFSIWNMTEILVFFTVFAYFTRKSCAYVSESLGGTRLDQRRTAAVFVSLFCVYFVVAGLVSLILVRWPFPYRNRQMIYFFTKWISSAFFTFIVVLPSILAVRTDNLKMIFKKENRRSTIMGVLCLAIIALLELFLLQLIREWAFLNDSSLFFFAHYLSFPLVICSNLLLGKFGLAQGNLILCLCSFSVVAPATPDAEGYRVSLNQLIRMQILLAILIFATASFGILIAENKRLYQQIVTAKETAELNNKQKSKFMSYICHELRNGLHATTNLVEFLDEDMTRLTNGFSDNGKNDVGEITKAIKTSTKYLSNLIDDVLHTDKLENGMVYLEYIPTDVVQIAKTMAMSRKHQLQGIGIQFQYDIDYKSIPQSVIIDPIKFQQIVQNLMSNSSKFTYAGGLIQLQLSASPLLQTNSDCQKVTLKLLVSDTGVGMSEDAIQALFKPYSQAKISTAREFGGSGLGLAIVKQIVDLMEGSITVHSQEGVGTKFIIEIPVEVVDITPSVACSIVSDEQSPNKEANQKEGCSSSDHFLRNVDPQVDTEESQPAQVLLVDDSPINRKILLRMLNFLGVQRVDQCENGLECVNKIKEAQNRGQLYDLVFLDLQMPVMTGQEAIKQIRNVLNLSQSDLPVVAVTANMIVDSSDNDEDGLQEFNSIYPKPFIKADCQKLLKKYLLIQ